MKQHILPYLCSVCYLCTDKCYNVTIAHGHVMISEIIKS